MNLFFRLIPYFFVFLLLSPHYSVAAPVFPRLAKPPIGERWFSISKENEQAGFNRIEINEAVGGYEIIVESGAKMTVFGFSRDASSWERYLVNPDLSLRSFDVDEVIDGNPIKLKGQVVAGGVRVSISKGGKTKEKLLRAIEPVYPPPAVNIYPLMQGADPGKIFKLKMLDIEAVKVIGVKITVIGPETLAGGKATIHMQNDLYTFVDNDIWVDHSGNTVKESVRHGLILTQTEDREAAKKFLATHPWLKRR